MHSVSDKLQLQSNSYFACHTLRDKSKGPPYVEVANRYHDKPGEHEKLAGKIREGSKGETIGIEIIGARHHIFDVAALTLEQT